MKSYLFLAIASLIEVGELAISFDECGKSVNCLKNPKGCTSFAACKSVAIYYYNAGTAQLEIQLTSTGAWVAFGQVLKTSPDYMTNLHGAYCIKGSNEPDFGLFISTGIGAINYVDTSKITSVKLLEKTSNGTYFSCLYSRPLDVGIYADTLLPINDTLYLAAIAYGSSLNANGKLNHHESRITSEDVINWTQNPQLNIIIDSSNVPIVSSAVSIVPTIALTNIPSASGVVSTVALANSSSAVYFSTIKSTSLSLIAAANSSSSSTSNSDNSVTFKATGFMCKASFVVIFASALIILFI